MRVWRISVFPWTAVGEGVIEDWYTKWIVELVTYARRTVLGLPYYGMGADGMMLRV